MPRKEWPELIGKLADNIQQKANADLVKASMQTLGYICEDLKPDDME